MTIQTIQAWSITSLLEYELCPHRSYLRLVVKSPQPDLPEDHPLVRGSRIHKECEQYINGATEAFPTSGKKLQAVLDYCRVAYAEGRATVEDQWGFNQEWQPADWFGEDVWCRMATDCIIVDNDAAEIYDWKTGKSFGNEVKYMQQMQLYAIGAFMRYSDLDYIDVRLGFLDDGKLREKSFERGSKINKLIAKFTERGNRMTNAVDFRPKPNVYNCKWCPFGPGGTGACVYGVESL